MGVELILAMVIASVAVKHTAVNGALDVMFARRGQAAPHHDRAMKRLELYRDLTSRSGGKVRSGQAGSAGTGRVRSGQRRRAFGRYCAALWADSWDDARSAHDRKRAARVQARESGQVKPGAARTYAAGLRRDAWDRWDRAWTAADAKRQARRSGQDQAPAPDPSTGPDLTREPDPTPDLGTGQAPDPSTAPGPDPTPDLGSDPSAGPVPDPSAGPTPDPTPDLGSDPSTGPRSAATVPTAPAAGDTITRKAPPAMSQEITGLKSAINFFEQLATSCEGAPAGIDQAQAAMAQGEVTGEAPAAAAAVAEHLAAAAAASKSAAAELKSHIGVAEQYAAHPGAGNKQFVTSE